MPVRTISDPQTFNLQMTANAAEEATVDIFDREHDRDVSRDISVVAHGDCGDDSRLVQKWLDHDGAARRLCQVARHIHCDRVRRQAAQKPV